MAPSRRPTTRAASAAALLAIAALALIPSAACDRLARAAGLCAAIDARIVVDTNAHRLTLCDRAQETATFGVRIGSAGAGKSKEGDNKTPLGIYPLGAPRKSQQYGTFIPVGYPTSEQRRRGFTGGDIGVHGPHRLVRWAGSLVNTFDSTSGCVGIATDAEMDRIAAWVKAAGARTIELR
jgi:L,D-peptidoglycan transpeptidase YkuD (ErfK/YbiS/YcfS/YnhG family)